MISLDNNAAERALRRPVVTRKNAYGSRTEDAARLAARVWTITATAEMAGLNPITYLTAYLDTCGRTGGKPLDRPGPGTVPALDRDPRRPGRLGTATPPRLTPPPTASRRHHGETVTPRPGMPSTGLPNTYTGSGRTRTVRRFTRSPHGGYSAGWRAAHSAAAPPSPGSLPSAHPPCSSPRRRARREARWRRMTAFTSRVTCSNGWLASMTWPFFIDPTSAR